MHQIACIYIVVSIENSLLQDRQLCFIKLLLTFFYSRKQLQFLHLSLGIPPVKLSTKFHSDVAINLMLSMNFILWYKFGGFIAFFIDFHTFFIEMEKVKYFSLFSAIQSNWPSNSFVNSYFEPLWKTTWISLGTLPHLCVFLYSDSSL